MEWKEARKTEITIGSLFDGIGGFPLAGNRCGIKTLWASEIEPFPIKVSSIRFPGMKQMGDITKIDCNSLELVDIVTGGSPCQDLSVAGKRAGLAGARSGLFMEQIRIVRELREIDKRNGRTGEFIRPRFMVWENVPGAFSSNKGEDFRAVLEEICRVKDETITIPKPPKGKWSTVGAIMGNGYSIAWRVLDAQYWGVPQRRRRIFLVADFGGQSAPEVLFKRKGLSRHLAKGGEARERVTADAERSTPKTMLVRCGCRGGGKGPLIQDDKSATLSTLNIQTLFQPQGERVWDKCPARAEMHGNIPAVTTYSFQRSDEFKETDKASTQSRRQYKDATDLIVSQRYSVRRLTPLECERLQGFPDGWTDIPGQTEATQEELKFWRDVWLTWDKTQAEDPEKVKPRTDKAILKWLKNPVSDSAQYKGLGNSVAVPCPEYVMEGIKEVMEATNEK